MSDIFKLDVKDKKILRIITEEARTPLSAIAKKVGLSKGAVTYRIKQLEKKGIISKYLVEVDPLLLGYDSYDLFMKFKMPPGGKKSVHDYFNSHPNVCWSATLSGEWNYFAELMCRSIEEFHELTKKMIAEFAEVLEDYKFYIAGEIFRHTQMIDLISEGKSKRFRPDTKPGVKAIPLDDAERKILSVMSENADLPVHKIAKRAGLTSETVRYRIAKLRKSGILVRTSAVINYRLLGYDSYILRIKLKNLSPEKETEIRTYLERNTTIQYAYRALGSQRIFALMYTSSINEMEEQVAGIHQTFFDSIRRIYAHHIIQEQNFVMFPKVMQSS